MDSSVRPGEVVGHESDGPVISCLGGEAVVLTRIQRPGKRAVSGAEFLRGTGMAIGTRLDTL